jgi:hypothetical protein
MDEADHAYKSSSEDGHAALRQIVQKMASDSVWNLCDIYAWERVDMFVVPFDPTLMLASAWLLFSIAIAIVALNNWLRPNLTYPAI